MSSNANDDQARQLSDVRRRRYRSGLNAEMLVAAVYMALGHRILGRRF